MDDDCFSLDFIRLLDNQVWGHGFPPPLFCDEFIVVNQRVLKEKHLKLQLEKNGRHYSAIQFGSTALLPRHAQLAYRLDANEFNGRTSVQLIIEHAEGI